MTKLVRARSCLGQAPLALSLAVGLCLACGPQETAADAAVRGPRGEAVVGGDVLSTVDGVAITVADVERVVAATELPPSEALRLLQEEELLAGVAEAEGYGDRRAVTYAGRQAAVQALLAEIEARVTVHDVPEARLTEAFEQSRTSLTNPALRDATHALCPVSPLAPTERVDEARRCAERALVELTEADDVEAAFDAMSGRPVGDGEIAVATIGLFPRDAAQQAPQFVEAAFLVARTGPLAEPVRTEAGFHAIVVTDVREARVPDFARDAPGLRERLVTTERFNRVAGLIQQLTARHGVARATGAIERILNQPLER